MKGEQPGVKAEPLEIERKFLIGYPDIAWLESQNGCRRMEITQTYLKADEGEEERVRCRTECGREEYVHTVKRRVSDIKRVEIERAIPREAYLRLLEQTDPDCRPIQKTRYCLPYEGHALEIDVYPFWHDQAVMEIELADENEPIYLPPEIQIIREVTGEKAFKNASLARTKSSAP